VRLPDRDPLKNLAYMTDCTLATVYWLQGKARPPKGELERQRKIALFGVVALREAGYAPDRGHDAPLLDDFADVDEIITFNAGRKYGIPVMPWDEDKETP
jgi:hypothetical protein